MICETLHCIYTPPAACFVAMSQSRIIKNDGWGSETPCLPLFRNIICYFCCAQLSSSIVLYTLCTERVCVLYRILLFIKWLVCVRVNVCMHWLCCHLNLFQNLIVFWSSSQSCEKKTIGDITVTLYIYIL